MKKIWFFAVLAAMVILCIGCIQPKTAQETNERNVSKMGDFEQLKTYEQFVDNVEITPVPNTTLALAKNYPPVNWRFSYMLASRVTAEAPQWSENYFLPGNTTLEQKKNIIAIENKGLLNVLDECGRDGYRFLDLRMVPPVKLSGSLGQSRTWLGSGRLPMGNASAVVYLDNKGSRIETQAIGFEQAYVKEILRFERNLEIKNHDPGASVKMSVWYRMNTEDCTACLNREKTFECNPLPSDYIAWEMMGVKNPEIFVKAVCAGVMNKSQLAYAQNALAGSSFTFAMSRETS